MIFFIKKKKKKRGQIIFGQHPFWRKTPPSTHAYCLSSSSLCYSHFRHNHLPLHCATTFSHQMTISSVSSSHQNRQQQQQKQTTVAQTGLSTSGARRSRSRRPIPVILDFLESSLRLLHFSNKNHHDPWPDRPKIDVEVR